MTYAFGRLVGLGTLPWHESEVTGRMLGNPSVSAAVSSYMLSLRRRKVSTSRFETKLTNATVDWYHRLKLERRQQVPVQLHQCALSRL
jgi:hypothetical protein